MKKISFITMMLALALSACGDNPPEEFGPAGTLWKLQSFQLDDGTAIDVAEPDHYTLFFNWDGTLQVTADCNTCEGRYSTSEGIFRMIVDACTREACSPNSLDVRYLNAISRAQRFRLEGDKLFIHYFGGLLRFGI